MTKLPGERTWDVPNPRTEDVSSDIVEQLRFAHAWFDVDSKKTVPVERAYGLWLFKSSADEIEKLRAANQHYRVTRAANEYLEGEIARLREVCEAILAHRHDNPLARTYGRNELIEMARAALASEGK